MKTDRFFKMFGVFNTFIFSLSCLLLISLPDGTVSIKNEALELCVESEAFGMSSQKISPDSVTGSTFIYGRDPNSGRLFGDSAWQARSNDFNQYLQVDLGERKLITSVATQGYRGSDQYVLAYHIQYSNDGTTFTAVVNELNEPKEYEGNTNDDIPQFNFLDYPLVAQYIRFVPLRWNINIAMRVELYGCDYEGHAVSFDGNSYITFNAYEPNYLFSTTDMMRMRLKTNAPEGLIFYGAGNQGDYILFELYMGRLYVDIQLGAYTQARGVAGSLLDNNQWHDIEMARKDKNITISVDRVPVNITVMGEYKRLDLDRFLYLGGVSTFYQPGITVRQNFIGCIENMVWNGIHITRDKDVVPRFNVVGMLGGCQNIISAITMTLSRPVSIISVPIRDTSREELNFEFQFRTFNPDRLLVYTNFTTSGVFYLSIDADGYIQYELRPEKDAFRVLEVARSDKNEGSYANGLWHHVKFVAMRNMINLTVDGKEFITTRQLQFGLTSNIILGGGHTEKIGFVGCIRQLRVQLSNNIFCGNGAVCSVVQNNTCAMEDRCQPSPCEHGSKCSQTFETFTCDCTGTRYEGATCHQPTVPNSCSRLFELNPLDTGILDSYIDIDGAGSMPPFPVQCQYADDKNQVATILHHDSEYEIQVDGYQLPGSYRRVIQYDAQIPQIDQLVDRADTCEQHISYRCEASHLLAHPGIQGTNPGNNPGSDGRDQTQEVKAWGWWIGRNYQFNYYWGGSAPGTQMCECGITDTCTQSDAAADRTVCNCDAGKAETGISDSGFLRHKEHLPALELRFGDTGATQDEQRGWHTLGPLRCYGDKFFDKPITFRKLDAVIFFDTFWSREQTELTTWDMSFRFRTSAESGVLVSRRGTVDEGFDFVEIKLVTSTAISMRFSAGYGVQAVVSDNTFALNDNKWHTIYAERNRKEALVKVDEFEAARLQHPQGIGFIPFRFTSPLVVGASWDYKDGYVGCMSSLQVNGETLDLYDKVENDPLFSYGLRTGCVGQCEPNPCLNGGKCIEKYNEFVCDCSYTPWRGLICGREVGTFVDSGQALIYDIPGKGLSTNSENITIGFLTGTQQGVMMQLTDSLDPATQTQYLTFEIEAGGAVVVNMKANSQIYKTTLNYDNIKFANWQPHIIRFNRMNNGRSIELAVDNYYPPEIVPESELSQLFPDGSDVYLDIKYIIIGRNQTLNEERYRFKGCIFRVEFDNHWPLKRVFQAPRPDHVLIQNSAGQVDWNEAFEERCGFEEILPADSNDTETRPTFEPQTSGTVYEDFVDSQTTGQNTIYLSIIFSVVGIILIVVISVVVYKCRHVGAYPDSDEEELEALDGEHHDDYGTDYAPRSSREQYEMKNKAAPPSSQTFI